MFEIRKFLRSDDVLYLIAAHTVGGPILVFREITVDPDIAYFASFFDSRFKQATFRLVPLDRLCRQSGTYVTEISAIFNNTSFLFYKYMVGFKQRLLARIVNDMAPNSVPSSTVATVPRSTYLALRFP